MSNDSSVHVWRRLLEGFTPGEMTVRQFCDAQGVSLHQYYYWRRRLAAITAQKATDKRWLAVDVVDCSPIPTPSSGLTLRIAGAEIDLAAGFDPALLRAVVQALGAPSC